MPSRALRVRLVLSLWISSLALAGCPGKQETTAPGASDAPPPESVAGHTSGSVSRQTVIRVRFTGDLVSASDLNKPLSPSPFRVEPAVTGEATWSGPRELQLRPDEPLGAGRRYKVFVDLSVLPELEGRVAPFGFEFDVTAPSYDLVLTGLSPAAEGPEGGQELSGTIATADVSSPEDIERMLSVRHQGDSLTITWSHDLGARRHGFTVAGITRQETESQVEVEVDGSPISVERQDRRQVSVPGLNQFVLSRADPITTGTQHVEARFSDPLDPGQDLTGLVHSSDGASLRFVVERNVLRIYRSDRWPTQVTLVFETGIRNASGHRLQERTTHTVGFAPLPPEVRFASKGVILPSSGDLTLPIEAANLRALDVQAIRVHPDNLTQFLQVNPLDGNREMRRVGRIVWRDTIELSPPAGSETRFVQHGLDVSALLRDEPEGLYQIRLSFRPQHSLFECPAGTFRADFQDDGVPEEEWDEEDEHSYWGYYETYLGDSIWAGEAQPWEMWQQRNNPCHPGYYRKHQDHQLAVTRNILVTNVGVIAKRGTDGSLFIAVTDLRTAQPRAGAEVRVLDYQRQELASGWTKLDGTVLLETAGQPYFVLAAHEGSQGIVRLEPGSALAVGHLDVGGLQVSEGLKGLIYGERGVWRPGDDIFLTFLLHDPEDRVPADHPIRFELLNSRGQVVQQSTQPSSLNGFYALRTRTSPTDPTGDYRARVHVGGATFEEILKIETVMPNRLKIDMDLSLDEPILGPKPRITTTLRSAWLHGAIARRLRTEVEMTLRPAPTRFERWEGYSFDDPTRQFRAETSTIFQGTLDDSGEARIDEGFDTGRPPGMLTAHLSTRVFEPGGAFSVDQFTVPVSPYERYIGVRTPPGDRSRGMLLTDEKHPALIVAVDAGGNPVSGVEVEVALYQIQWRWWWESGPEELPDYTASTGHTPIQQGKVRLENGEGVFEFEVAYPSWGRYLLMVRDPVGGHRTGRIMYIDWPGWAGRAMEDRPGAASVLAVTADMDRYAPGQTATLTIPTPHLGRALVTLETGSRVRSASWIEATGDTTRHTIPIEADMAPGVYAHVTLIQPHGQRGNDLPMRLYGVVPIEVEDPRTRISPTITTADVFEPQSTVQVNIAESAGRPMTYTLAVVDEGLLGLTRFQTPDAWSRFYRREALGVTTWDVFDDVAGAYGGAFDRLVAIGGDADAEGESADQKADRFPPVVRFLGPFALNSDETRTHAIDIPQYVGAVRVMVVAGQDGAFGRAQKTVLVKKPLMLLATLPRVLGPGEDVDLPVSVFVLEEGIRDVALLVETSDGIAVVGDAGRTLSFPATGDQMTSLRLKVSQVLGVQRVRVIATAGGERAEQEIEIEVRHPGRPELRILAGTIEPQETWTPEMTLTGVAGTNRVSLEVSRMAPMDLSAHLDYLIGYPHGCLEQTMSQAFPQLHLTKLLNLDAGRQAEISRNLQAGIARVSSHQTASGGFGYWASNDQPHDWTSSYVGHFLLEAKANGQPVPLGILQRWEGYQRRTAQAFVPGSEEQTDLAQAYRLYTLALAGRAEMGPMNRLREWQKLSLPARWRLAAAYHLAGQPEAASRLVAGLSTEVAPYQEPGPTFGSALRDQAMILETAVLMGDSDKVGELSRQLSATLSGQRQFNTQELGFALIAMARAFEKFGEAGEMRFAYEWNGRRSELAEDRPIHIAELAPGGAPGLTVTNRGSSVLFTRLLIRGLPEVGTETGAERGLRVTVAYQDTNGKQIAVDRLEQGTDLMARVTVTNTRQQNLSEIALTHIVPSGWEIRNERQTSGGASAPGESAFDYRDVRDDRVHTYFDLGRGESRTFEVRLHSAYPGRFYLPGIAAEAMYDETIHGRTTGAWVEVVRPGLTG